MSVPGGPVPAGPSGRYGDLAELLKQARRSDRWQRVPPEHADAFATTVDLVTRPAPEAYLDLHRLIEDHGHQRVALMQGGLGRLLGPRAHTRIETGLIWRIGDEAHTRTRLTAAGTDADTAADAAARCYGHMFWLLLRDIEGVAPMAELPVGDGFRRLIRQGTVREWRAALAPVAAHPWGPRGEELAQLAEDAGLPVVAESLRACRRAYRLLREDQERRAVADEVRQRVAVSGQTQRAFASYVGTSGSRLSTYISGKVTPSAAMLLRIQRASELLAERAEAGAAD